METSIEFLAPRCEGGRFDMHLVPVDVLGDMVALQELITAAARWKYLQDHPGRSRLPRSLSDHGSLGLAEVRKGSAIPVIMMLCPPSLFPQQEEGWLYYDWARNAVRETVATAENGSHEAYALPNGLLPHFKRFGKNLRNGEAMVLDPANQHRPARLTKESRGAILQRWRKEVEFKQVALRGIVPEMDQNKRTFEFELTPKQRIKINYAPEQRDQVLEAFNGHRLGRKLMIRGRARYNSDEQLLGFDTIDSLELLNSLDTGARLEELKLLGDGWLNGKGLAPDPLQLDWLDSAIHRFYSDGPLPRLYPTAEGGVQAEWRLGAWDVSLEIDLSHHDGAWHALHLVTDEEKSRVLNLDNPADWQWLQTQVKAFENPAA